MLSKLFTCGIIGLDAYLDAENRNKKSPDKVRALTLLFPYFLFNLMKKVILAFLIGF